jgi:hypothetical protein
VFLHGARAESEKQGSRRKGDPRENERHAKVRRACRPTLSRKDREGAKPFEGREYERALNGTSCQRPPHHEERDHGQGQDQQRDVSGTKKVRRQKKEGEGHEKQA